MTISLGEGSLDVPMSEGIVYIFPFTASADQEIVISAISSQRDLDADPLVLILDPDGLPLTANDDTGEWWDSYVQFRAPVSGEYALVMTHAGGSTEGRVEVSFDIAGMFTLGNDGRAFQSRCLSRLDVWRLHHRAGELPPRLESQSA